MKEIEVAREYKRYEWISDEERILGPVGLCQKGRQFDLATDEAEYLVFRGYIIEAGASAPEIIVEDEEI